MEPTLSVKGKMHFLGLLNDHGNIRSWKKQKGAAKYGLHHTWERKHLTNWKLKPT